MLAPHPPHPIPFQCKSLCPPSEAVPTSHKSHLVTSRRHQSVVYLRCRHPRHTAVPLHSRRPSHAVIVCGRRTDDAACITLLNVTRRLQLARHLHRVTMAVDLSRAVLHYCYHRHGMPLATISTGNHFLYGSAGCCISHWLKYWDLSILSGQILYRRPMLQLLTTWNATSTYIYS